ncbi:MAG TPA: hypothetical protein VEH00_11580 [Steroidobacteraceae bacterium]|nr:hypothetical protein [Steroidobacteraceae bacterium]
MRAHRIRLVGIIGVIVAALSVAGCNSSSDDTSGSTTNASATGVWSGTDSVSGLSVTAFINSAGQATFIRGDGVQFFGTAQVSADTIAVTVDGYSDFPAAFSDGSTYGLGTLNGTVTTGSTITATLSFTTNAGTAIGGSWSLTFEALSNNASSTAAVSANYTDSVTGAVLSITSNGDMTEQNASNGCVLNGSISTNDSSHDIYEVAYTFGNCTGTYAVLNGVQFTGLASLNTSLSAAQLTMAVTGASSTSKYAITSTLSGS